MSRPVFFRPEANFDVEEISAYLLLQRPRTKAKFIAKLDRLIEGIQVMPFMYAKQWRSVRCAKISRFNYVVYYIVTKYYIDVFAIMHGARESSSWKSRL